MAGAQGPSESGGYDLSEFIIPPPPESSGNNRSSDIIKRLYEAKAGIIRVSLRLSKIAETIPGFKKNNTSKFHLVAYLCILSSFDLRLNKNIMS